MLDWYQCQTLFTWNLVPCFQTLGAKVRSRYGTGCDMPCFNQLGAFAWGWRFSSSSRSCNRIWLPWLRWSVIDTKIVELLEIKECGFDFKHLLQYTFYFFVNHNKSWMWKSEEHGGSRVPCGLVLLVLKILPNSGMYHNHNPLQHRQPIRKSVSMDSLSIASFWATSSRRAFARLAISTPWYRCWKVEG